MAYEDVDYLRSIVSKLYPSKNWRNKVRNMSDSQVIAIYYSFRDQDKRKKQELKKEKQNIEEKKIETTKANMFEAYSGEQLVMEGFV